MSDRRVVFGLLAAFLVILAVWTAVLRWMRRPEPPTAPAVPSISVSGYGAEKVEAGRVYFSVRACGDEKTLTAALRDFDARAKKLDVELRRGAAEVDEQQICRELSVASTKIAAALRLHSQLVGEAPSGLHVEDEEQAECTGDIAVAGARRKAEMAAIDDAQKKLAGLVAATHATVGPTTSADVSSEIGEWDSECEREISATATLTITPR